MADPALPSILDAIAAKLEAITPTVDAGRTFRRSSETAPATTKNARIFEIDFMGQPADLSAAGSPGATQTVGVADVTASFHVRVSYPLARQRRTLDATLAADSELVRRALSRSANWAGTSVRALRSFRSAVSWPDLNSPLEAEPGIVYLEVDVTFLYRETEV